MEPSITASFLDARALRSASVKNQAGYEITIGSNNSHPSYPIACYSGTRKGELSSAPRLVILATHLSTYPFGSRENRKYQEAPAPYLIHIPAFSGCHQVPAATTQSTATAATLPILGGREQPRYPLRGLSSYQDPVLLGNWDQPWHFASCPELHPSFNRGDADSNSPIFSIGRSSTSST